MQYGNSFTEICDKMKETNKSVYMTGIWYPNVSDQPKQMLEDRPDNPTRSDLKKMNDQLVGLPVTIEHPNKGRSSATEEKRNTYGKVVHSCILADGRAMFIAEFEIKDKVNSIEDMRNAIAVELLKNDDSLRSVSLGHQFEVYGDPNTGQVHKQVYIPDHIAICETGTQRKEGCHVIGTFVDQSNRIRCPKDALNLLSDHIIDLIGVTKKDQTEQEQEQQPSNRQESREDDSSVANAHISEVSELESQHIQIDTSSTTSVMTTTINCSTSVMKSRTEFSDKVIPLNVQQGLKNVQTNGTVAPIQRKVRKFDTRLAKRGSVQEQKKYGFINFPSAFSSKRLWFEPPRSKSNRTSEDNEEKKKKKKIHDSETKKKKQNQKLFMLKSTTTVNNSNTTTDPSSSTSTTTSSSSSSSNTTMNQQSNKQNNNNNNVSMTDDTQQNNAQSNTTQSGDLRADQLNNGNQSDNRSNGSGDNTTVKNQNLQFTSNSQIDPELNEKMQRLVQSSTSLQQDPELRSFVKELYEDLNYHKTRSMEKDKEKFANGMDTLANIFLKLTKMTEVVNEDPNNTADSEYNDHQNPESDERIKEQYKDFFRKLLRADDPETNNSPQLLEQQNTIVENLKTLFKDTVVASQDGYEKFKEQRSELVRLRKLEEEYKRKEAEGMQQQQQQQNLSERNVRRKLTHQQSTPGQRFENFNPFHTSSNNNNSSNGQSNNRVNAFFENQRRAQVWSVRRGSNQSPWSTNRLSYSNNLQPSVLVNASKTAQKQTPINNNNSSTSSSSSFSSSSSSFSGQNGGGGSAQNSQFSQIQQQGRSIFEEFNKLREQHPDLESANNALLDWNANY